MLNAPTRSDLDALSSQPLTSVLYVSHATDAFDPEGLPTMLKVSRAKNWIRNLTGLLLWENGRFLHYLEGPADAVQERMEHISADGRHTHLRMLARRQIAERLFPRWTMAYAGLTEVERVTLDLRNAFTDQEATPDLAAVEKALERLADWLADQHDHPTEA